MLEDIKLTETPHSSGVYFFKDVNGIIIYIGSSCDLYNRMAQHRSCIKAGGAYQGKKKADLYQFLQLNSFTIEFQMTDDYKQLEQQLIEKHHPKFNQVRAYTACGMVVGRKIDYNKDYYIKYKDEILNNAKDYYQENRKKKLTYAKTVYELHKEEKRQYQKKYCNQLCSYNGETLTLNALKLRFKKQGIPHPTLEAKKYLIKSS